MSNRSARLVAWSNAVALGLASPDLAAAEVVGADPAHRVVGLDESGLAVGGAGGGAEDGTSAVGTATVTLPVLMAMVRRGGRATARLALPAPGDPAGLPADDPVATAALVAGEVALLPDLSLVRGPGADDTSWGLVPTVDDHGVRWTAYRATGLVASNGAESLTDADHVLAASLREATSVLNGLDAAAWTDQDADELAALRSGRLDGDGLAPGYPERAVAVLVRARRLRTIVRLASRDDGGALTAPAAATRMAALTPLDRAARHAEMAAYNAVADATRQHLP